MTTFFSCFKNTEKTADNQPDYNLTAKIGDNFEPIGAGWIKDMKGGGKYISFQLNEEPRSYVNKAGETVQVNAFKLVKVGETASQKARDMAVEASKDAPNIDDIPF